MKEDGGTGSVGPGVRLPIYFSSASVWSLEGSLRYIPMAALYDGRKYLAERYRTEPENLFGGVELLTLSACETGAQKVRESDGREIDSFAELAQRKGAQAILASLWKVDDASTSRLMVGFYRTRQHKNLTRAEALQGAQLTLLKDGRYAHPFYW